MEGMPAWEFSSSFLVVVEAGLGVEKREERLVSYNS